MGAALTTAVAAAGELRAAGANVLALSGDVRDRLQVEDASPSCVPA